MGIIFSRLVFIVKKTATTVDVNNAMNSSSIVDLEVSERRVSYTYFTEKSVRRGGLDNIYAVAVKEALKENGNAEVLVAPEFETRIRKGMFGRKVKTVIVTGYPAKYKNFRKATGEDLEALNACSIPNKAEKLNASSGGLMGIFKKEVK